MSESTIVASESMTFYGTGINQKAAEEIRATALKFWVMPHNKNARLQVHVMKG